MSTPHVRTLCTRSRRPAPQAARAADQGPGLPARRRRLPLRSRRRRFQPRRAARRQIVRSPGPPMRGAVPGLRGDEGSARRITGVLWQSRSRGRRSQEQEGLSGLWLQDGGKPSRPPSTQAEPSRPGPGRQGRSSGSALHLGALALARSPAGGSTADGMANVGVLHSGGARGLIELLGVKFAPLVGAGKFGGELVATNKGVSSSRLNYRQVFVQFREIRLSFF